MSDLEIWWQAYLAALMADKHNSTAELTADMALEHYQAKERELDCE